MSIFPIDPTKPMTDIEREGFEAYENGDIGDQRPEDASPYLRGCDEWGQWVRGWHRACAGEYPDMYHGEVE